jgi:phospholipid/cholesterol/gamma-HCH transport system substrate-binding protein
MMDLFSSAKGRVLAVALFVVVCISSIVGLLIPAGFFSGFGNMYSVKVQVADVDNAVKNGQVRIAGVRVGDILAVEAHPGGAIVTLGFRDEYKPLHEGAIVRVGNRSLVEETYFDITDGKGAAIPDGGSLPASSVQTSTQLRDLLDSLDEKTRASLSAMLRSTGSATKDTHEPVGQLFAGLGGIGGDGNTALAALGDQSQDLKLLLRDTTTMLNALDTGQGQIATMVDNANRLTAATAEQKPAIEATMVRLPGVLDSAYHASASLHDLSDALRPVAHGLSDAAPRLRDALHDLPDVSRDLRRMLPHLDRVLDRAPRTLHKVHRFSSPLKDDVIPNARDILQDANPMLGFMAPYGPELGGMIGNFGAILNYQDESGRQVFHASLVTPGATAVGSPINPGNLGRSNFWNPIPKAGTMRHFQPFDGKYPRIEREPK